MPELPEVQTVVNSLKNNLLNRKITRYYQFWNKVIYTKNTSILNKFLKQSPKIVNIDRIGKYIILFINTKFIVFHLRMTGYLYYSKALSKKIKHLRCYFELDNNNFLIYEDIRKFGGFYFLENLNLLYNKLGLDPISNSNFTNQWIEKNILTHNRKLKGLLLDQSFIAGLGNIYIDEILWKSKIHPNRKSNSLSELEIKSLYHNIKNTLNESINFHGTTIINFKFDNMKTGKYKNKLKVYGRENKKCTVCLNTIIKEKIYGRSTYLCKLCQKM